MKKYSKNDGGYIRSMYTVVLLPSTIVGQNTYGMECWYQYVRRRKKIYQRCTRTYASFEHAKQEQNMPIYSLHIQWRLGLIQRETLSVRRAVCARGARCSQGVESGSAPCPIRRWRAFWRRWVSCLRAARRCC